MIKMRKIKKIFKKILSFDLIKFFKNNPKEIKKNNSHIIKILFTSILIEK